MSWILPKGIVVNSPQVQGSIERINTEPLDLADIAKFWKVYTTTKRRLLDPTAERLENYWWRIWGSRRRELNGATIASLFRQISNGESFVPLLGPPNRDEGTSTWKRTAPGGSGASSTTALHQPNQSRPSTTSSSVSKSAVVPHPILKKTRGPSTTGPRPTARFISPHESEDDSGDPELSSARVVVQPPSPDRPSVQPEKRAATSGNGSKKVRGVVSSPSTKRPVVFRRKSSHSSTESPARSMETASSGLGSSLEMPAYLEVDDNDSTQPLQSKFRENFSPSNRLPSLPQNKHGARNIDSKRLSPRQSTVPRKDRAGQAAGSDNSLEDSGPSALSTVDRRSSSKGDPIAKEQEAIESRKTLAPQDHANESQLTTETPPRRSQSDTFQGSQRTLQPTSDSKEPRDAGVLHYLSSEAKSTPSLAPTLAAATGQVALGSAVDPPAKPSGSKKPDKGKRRASDEARTGKTPSRKTAVSSNGKEDASSLARSKSQLALVLEKDRARSGDRDVKKE